MMTMMIKINTDNNYVTILICLYLYEYLLLYNILYIVENNLMSTFQHKFGYVNPSSYS